MDAFSELPQQGCDIYDFINKLCTEKYFTIKQLTHIENIVIYINNLQVYKVVLAVYPNELKKARKLGLNQQYIIYEKDFGLIKHPKMAMQRNSDISHGKYLLIYKPCTQDFIVWEGEAIG